MSTSEKFKKHREYPIKRDEYGVSARKRAFKLFDQGLRPAKIAEQVGISKNTCYKYFEDWKNEPHDFNTRYEIMKYSLHRSPALREKLAEAIAEHNGMSVEYVVQKLQTPYGLKQYMKGKWRNYAEEREKAMEENRIHAAKTLIWLVDKSRHVTAEKISGWIEKYRKAEAETKAKYDKLKEG